MTFSAAFTDGFLFRVEQGCTLADFHFFSPQGSPRYCITRRPNLTEQIGLKIAHIPTQHMYPGTAGDRLFNMLMREFRKQYDF